MTTTCSAVAVPGVAVVDGVGLGDAEMASCAITMLALQSIATDAIRNFFIEIFSKWIFQSGEMVAAFTILREAAFVVASLCEAQR